MRLALVVLMLLLPIAGHAQQDPLGAASWRRLKTLENCDDAVNDKLLFDITLQDFICGIDTAGSGGAPDSADYLVGTANGSLSAEIAVGTTPGGELGGTWASPTIDSGVVSFGELAAGTAADAQVDGSLEENEIDLLDLLDTAAADTCSGSEIVRRNAGDTAFECVAAGSGGGISYAEAAAAVLAGF